MASRNGKAEGQQELFEPTCPNGVPLNQAVSILIKELRRGKELEALYWARQMEVRFYKYVWRRLAIFAAEDVGLANPDLIVQVRSLWETYMQIMAESSSKSKPDGNILVMAVILIARSPKNREIDSIKNILGSLQKDANWAPEIPEYAVDTHTREGRKREDLQTEADKAVYWFSVASHVENREGYRDAELWHWRNMARQDMVPREDVERMAEDWDANGWLEHGVDGYYPVIPDQPKQLEKFGEGLDLHG